MKPRFFFAVEPCSEVKSIISDFVESANTEGIKTVEKENLHITLLFLGELETREVDEIKNSFGFLSTFEKFTVKFKGTGAFGTPPRVVFVTPISKALSDVANTIRAKMGITEEFSPHLTIGRVRKYGADISGLLTDRYFGECVIDSVVLKKSLLFSSGPVYSTAKKWDLL